MKFDQFTRALVMSRVIDPDAVEDAENYDDGATLENVRAAYRRLTAPTHGMTFGRAVEILKDGGRVARAGWNGKGMWLRLVEPYAPHPDTVAGRCEGVRTNPYFKAADNNADAQGTMLPWIGMNTADSKFVPWLASQTDVLAEDWVVTH